ncbi:hypothetical protein PAB09_05710 [Corynebacterium sp. SCR221107]|uniref:helix-turn-helix transcriptional regulator n=1 Tax=Corynebacterium sp. SCR221107 TaxID=3017361 RepID=UPI0022EC3CF7|nr:hypothetical protein [Corynebacterium sp. SCR221107]WBT09786.1 hypothetical protein PAB09_05710 [Corynebacterium sp. SCR221107]
MNLAVHPAPRPALELFPESLNLSPKQRSVLEVLKRFPQGAKVGEIAEAMGVHVNTARGHLDELLDRNAVVAVPTRSPGRGRPSLLYSIRVPDNRTVANEYVSLIGILTSYLEESDSEEAHKAAREIGRRWGSRLREDGLFSQDTPTALKAIKSHHTQMGFDPKVENQRSEDASENSLTMHLNSCPFMAQGTTPSPIMCAIHRGVLDEMLKTTSAEANLEPFTSSGPCTLTLDNPFAQCQGPASCLGSSLEVSHTLNNAGV